MKKTVITGIFLLIVCLIIPNVSCASSNQKAGTKQTSGEAKTQNIPAEISESNPDFIAPEVLGRPANNSITINIAAAVDMKLYVEYGDQQGVYSAKTDTINIDASRTAEVLLSGLQGNTRYYYRICYSKNGGSTFLKCKGNTFITQRSQGSTFTFDLQGDSHPERIKQFNPELYLQTMRNVKSDNPDFYMTMGDDFSVDTMKSITKSAVEQLFINQRKYLGLVGSSAPLFLVNGNHEQAAEYVLNGTPDNAAVWSQNARDTYFSEPAPDSFYTGDTEQIQYIGNLRDYYAWTWGDALFVVIDPYWHSSVPVDNILGGRDKQQSDMWGITLGDEQYQWLKKTLESSSAKYKFVFTHHVLGTGRGGIEMADLYEWGGMDKSGVYEFAKERPDWELPIHQLMAKNGVTIFFQGHDHLFAKEEKDGVIYQTLPEPADPNYTLYNADAYKSGIEFGNSGHVRVTVSDNNVKVDYVRSLLSKDETGTQKNGDVVYSYTVSAN